MNPITPPRRTAPWKVMAGLVVAGLVLGLAGAGVSMATGSWTFREPAEVTLLDAEAAYDGCQSFVRKQLKAPGPITFAPIRRRTAQRFVDGRYRVRAHADVPNASGRLVEINFSCTLKPLGGDRWDLQDLSIWTD